MLMLAFSTETVHLRLYLSAKYSLRRQMFFSKYDFNVCCNKSFQMFLGVCREWTHVYIYRPSLVHAVVGAQLNVHISLHYSKHAQQGLWGFSDLWVNLIQVLHSTPPSLLPLACLWQTPSEHVYCKNIMPLKTKRTCKLMCFCARLS